MEYITNNKGSLNNINAAFIKDLFDSILNQIKPVYNPKVPSIEIMYRLAFNKEVPLNEETIELIKECVLTNLLKKFSPDLENVQPKISLYHY